MHFLQRQIRLSSSTSRPQEKQIDYDENVKAIDIPASAYQTQSQPITHDTDNGHLFKVNSTIDSITMGYIELISLFRWCFSYVQASDLYVRLAAPNQLQPKPDVDNLVFGNNFTDHMLKIFWHKCLGGWQKAEITPMENIAIHPAAKVLHYAVEVIVFKTHKIQVFLEEKQVCYL